MEGRRGWNRERGRKGKMEALHQPHSNLKHIIAECEIRRIIPGVLSTFFDIGRKEGLLRVFEARHCCFCFAGYCNTINRRRMQFNSLNGNLSLLCLLD